jgi:hypothetical protein
MPNDATRRNIPEGNSWIEGIYQLETNDLALGGPEGIMNQQAKELATRTRYLKEKLEELAEAIPGTDEYNQIIEELKKLDVTSLAHRTDHLERLVGNAYLAFQMANIDPDGYDGMVIETFDADAPEIDRAVTVVNSLVSGDDSIDVEDSTNLIIGAHYQLTDGERLEEVQVKSINVAGSIKRVILAENIKNQYAAGRAKLYRSSVAIYNGRAYGGGTKSTDEWPANETFLGALTPQPLDTGVDMTGAALNVEGAMVEDGKLILGSPVVGVALVAEGGGSGTWAQVDEEGDALNG